MHPSLTILNADCLTALRGMESNSVHCCVTSPPYWGLRDYGVAGQLGLEKTPDEYIAKMVAVFREVRRVLRDDGTLWLNLGDSYARQAGDDFTKATDSVMRTGRTGKSEQLFKRGNNTPPAGLKPKDLVGIPWRLAFALQADGWVLRQEIIWHKPGPMPESVRDRCTKSHEQIFLLCKATWSGPNNGQFAHISDQDARWLAMFVDTEGNICIKRSERQESGRMQYGAQVAFANTSRALLEAAQQIVGSGSFHERMGKNSPVFYYQIAGQQARDFLHRIYPFLIVKQRQAALAIHVQDVLNTKGKKRPGGYRAPEHTDFLETAWTRMKMLNHFGNPDLSDVPVPEYGRWSGCSKYFYDAEAVKEPTTEPDDGRERVYGGRNKGTKLREQGIRLLGNTIVGNGATRNKRSVWTVPSAAYSEAHFATFPPNLIKPCILAGTSARGCCPKCGGPWERVVEKVAGRPASYNGSDFRNGKKAAAANALAAVGQKERTAETTTTGWQPTCDCGEADTQPCTVLDPFGGSGTTGMVALELGRKAVLIELNPEYVKLAEKRCHVTPGLPL